MDNSEIIHSKGGTMLAGRDAVSVYAALTLASALKLYANSKMLMTRGATPTVLLAKATEITQKKYKRGEYLKAADDVHAWAIEMRDAIPTTVVE